MTHFVFDSNLLLAIDAIPSFASPHPYVIGLATINFPIQYQPIEVLRSKLWENYQYYHGFHEDSGVLYKILMVSGHPLANTQRNWRNHYIAAISFRNDYMKRCISTYDKVVYPPTDNPATMEMFTFPSWMVHYGIWNRCILGFVGLGYWILSTWICMRCCHNSSPGSPHALGHLGLFHSGASLLNWHKWYALESYHEHLFEPNLRIRFHVYAILDSQAFSLKVCCSLNIESTVSLFVYIKDVPKL